MIGSLRSALVWILVGAMLANGPIMLLGQSAVPIGPVISTPAFLQPTARQLMATQAQIFEDLFAQPYDANEWTYPLDQQITGEGSYSGFNHLGQPFDLEIYHASPIDLASPELDLTPAERQLAIDSGFEYFGVVAALTTDLDWIPINGTTVYQSNSTNPFDCRLVVANREDPNHPAFEGQTLALTDDGGDTEIICVEVTIYCIDPDCASDCQDEYDEAVEEAQEDLDEAQEDYDEAVGPGDPDQDPPPILDQMDDAAEELQDDLNNAENSFATKAAIATAAIVAAHIKCATVVTFLFWFTGGAATLACVVAAQAVYAGKMAHAVYSYKQAKQEAQDDYNNTMQGLQAALDGWNAFLEAAQDAFQDAVDDAQEALEDCLDGCPMVVCGYILVCIIIQQPRGEGGGG